MLGKIPKIKRQIALNLTEDPGILASDPNTLKEIWHPNRNKFPRIWQPENYRFIASDGFKVSYIIVTGGKLEMDVVAPFLGYGGGCTLSPEGGDTIELVLSAGYKGARDSNGVAYLSGALINVLWPRNSFFRFKGFSYAPDGSIMDMPIDGNHPKVTIKGASVVFTGDYNLEADLRAAGITVDGKLTIAPFPITFTQEEYTSPNNPIDYFRPVPAKTY